MFTKTSIFLSSIPLVAALAVGACATSSSSNADIPVPTAKMAKASGESIDTLKGGYSLFQAHCAQCHELKMPKDMRVDEWHEIVPDMAWNVGLEKEDETAILAYLVAATQQVQSQ